MDLMTRVLRNLTPPIFGARITSLMEAISGAVQELYEYLRQTLSEANAGTADDTIAQWYSDFSLPYDSTLPLDSLQKQARQQWTATGGQALGVLNEQAQIAFPDISLARVVIIEGNMCGEGECGEMECEHYPSWYGGAEAGEEPVHWYFVTGDLDQPEELDRLAGLLDRIGPAEMEPVYTINVLGETETSQCGVAVCNLAECNAE